MKKFWLRICSLMLVIAMTANVLPLSALAELNHGDDSSFTALKDVEELEIQKNETYENSKIVREHIEGRTEFTKEFITDSGVSMAVVYGSPVHYEKNGIWEEIDNTLKVNSNNTITNTAGVWAVRFPQRISGTNQIQITKDGYTLSFGMGGELRKLGNLEVMSRTPISESQSMETESENSTDNTDPVQEETVASAPTEELFEITESVENITDAEALEEITFDEQETSLDIFSEEPLSSEEVLAEVSLEMTVPIAVLEETISKVTEDTTALEETVSQETIPAETELGTTVPEDTNPEPTVHDETETEVTTPEETEPETATPEDTTPETTVPDVTESETTVPEETVAVNVIPSVPTTSVSVDGVTQTFAISAASLSQGQIQEIDLKSMIDAAEHKETILTKPFSQLMYEGVYSNTNIQYNLVGNQVKESIILQSYDSDIRGYQFTLNTGDLIPVLEEDGHIDLYDPSRENIIMMMPAPFLQDSEMAHTNEIRVILSGSDGKYVLTYMLPLQWLADEERSWPVILDPVISASPDINNIHDVTVGSIYSYDYQVGVLEAGVDRSNGVQRFFVKYGEIPELSSSDVILSAVVRMYKPYSFSDYRTVEAHKVLEDWENYSMTWSNQPDCDPIVEDYVRVKDEGYYYFDVTDVVRDWYTEGNYGFMFKAPDTAEEQTSVVSWVQFYSCNFGAETVSPNLFMYFRNTNGVESYWDYTSSSAGRAGTGHINQYSGNLVWIHDDIGFGGNRMPVSISHVYNANDKSSTQYGVGAGWRTNFNQRVYRWDEDSDYRIWEDADGTKHYFEYESYGIYKDEDGLELTLTNTGSGNSTFCITDKNGNKSYFDDYGRLRKQENNQATKSNISVTYTTSSGYLIDTITDGAGRVYDFEYTNNKLSKIIYKGTGTGEVSFVSFGYTGNDLTSVQYKDGKRVTFAYDSTHLLTAATDIDGYALRYEYNTTIEGQPSRVSKVSEFDGSAAGGAMTFEYAHNQTTLTDHNGNVQILQFNDYGNTVSIQDGEGHAQYAKYAKNDSEETGKGNQLTASSKLQNTVSNLLADSSFEDGTLWTAVSGSRSINSSGYLGSKSMAVTSGRVNSSNFTVAAGENCTFSAYVKTSNANGVLALYEGGNAVATYNIPVCNDWTRVQVNYTNTSSSSKNLSAALQCASGQTIYMDCVQVEKAPTASRYNLVQNSDFRLSGTPAQKWTGSSLNSTDTRATASSSAAPQLDAFAMKIDGDPASQKKIYQEIPVSGAAGDTYVVTGWALANAVPFKEENQPSGEVREFAIRLIFNNTDNTKTSVTAQFSSSTNSTANWQYTAAAAVAEKAYSSVTVEAVYDHNANTAYFDGIQLYKEEFSQSYAYDDDGNVTSVIDLQKQETKYEYTNNNLTKQILPTGAELTYTYDNYHNVLTATTETGIVYKFTYDTYGNNTAVEIVKDGVSIKSTAAYSSDGNRIVSATDATGKTTTYSYNANTNVLEWVKYPEDTDTTKTTYTYDSMYRMASAAATTDTGLTLSAEYTYADDLLTAIETGSTTYNFGYGDFALRSNVTIGNRTLASYEYTSRNHYLSSLDYGNGDEVQYTYDNLGRVTKQTYEDGATVDYRYDNNGALATVTDSATGRTTTYYYDFIDRMMKYVESGERYNHSVGYEYDTINNLTKLVETINGTAHTTAYTYDDDNRITKVDIGSASKDYTYDGFGRASQQVTKNGSSTIKTDTFAFKAPSNIATSSQITSHTIDSAGLDITITYTYDDNGNILSASGNGYSVSYVYDSANQLVRENNGLSGKTRTWTYDNAGNILDCKEYAYTTGTLGAVQDTISYTYGDSSWGDLLTAYDGQTVTHDTIGNPLSDGTWTYTWQHGRQLASMAKSGTTWNFTYNADGLRTKRTNGTTTYSYVYNGDKLSQMTVGNDVLTFSYDASGAPMTVQYRGSTYYYVNSIQGDVIAILSGSGAVVVGYFYDAWGNHIAIDGDMANTLGTANPLRYRGYVYDQEYGLYYLQSRYYNPETGRFLNTDAFASTGQGMLGNNMFAYCGNNPVNYTDTTGYAPKINDADLIAQVGGTLLGLSLLPPPNTSENWMTSTTQVISDWYAQTKEDIKQLSQSLVDAAKKRWDDFQPCIHHVVPQGCTCEAATLARNVIGKNNVQSPENLVVIDYGTHRSIHSNGHMYCNLVNNALQTYGKEFGMALTKVYIALESVINGGYFYG